MFSGFFSRNVRTYRCRRLKASRPEDDVFDRQSRIPGFDQSVLAASSIVVIGAGGLGGETAEGLVRKGAGSVTLLDHDTVARSNLNRQYFGKSDIAKNKAVRLARNLSRMGFGGTTLTGIGVSFQRAAEKNLVPRPHVFVCGVDNAETRIYLSRYALEHCLPAVFSAVSRDGNNGYVFVQEAGGPCFVCVFGEPRHRSHDEGSQKCPPDPSIKDILKGVAGVVLYAVDSLLMARRRNWNYRELFLAGFVPDRCLKHERRSDCSVCGHNEEGMVASDKAPQ